MKPLGPFVIVAPDAVVTVHAPPAPAGPTDSDRPEPSVACTFKPALYWRGGCKHGCPLVHVLPANGCERPSESRKTKLEYVVVVMVQLVCMVLTVAVSKSEPDKAAASVFHPQFGVGCH